MAKPKDFSVLKKSKVKKPSDKPYITTVERLLTILSMLDKGKSVATAELADQLQVTRRTIQRDIALLGRCKYPIWEKIPGRYAFVEGFSLRKVSLTEEQASLMSFMGDIALSLGSKFENSFHELFKRLMVTSLDTPFYAKVATGGCQLPNTEIVKDLEKAIDNCQRVRQQYVSTTKGEKEYIIEPLKIAMFDGFWYCIAQDRTDRRILKFRIDRTKKVELLDETFVPAVDINKMLEQSVNIWFDGVRGDRVLIKVGAEVTKYFRQKTYFPLQKIVSEHKDGSFVVETYPAHPEEITHTIMHWIPYLTVLEPESFKEEIKKTVTAYLKSL